VVGFLGLFRWIRGEGAHVAPPHWLPDAHVEAPTAGSVILASVLLKMGTYGFLRFSLPLLPDSAKNPTIVNVMAVLSMIAIGVWRAGFADAKGLEEAGGVLLGQPPGIPARWAFFALNPAGISGSIIQQINPRGFHRLLFRFVGRGSIERRHNRRENSPNTVA